MLIRSKLTFGHGIVPYFAVDTDEIQDSIQWRNKLPANVVFRVQFQISAMT